MTTAADYKCVVYTPGDLYCESLVDAYIASTDIVNNQSRRMLRMEYYDLIKGALFLLVDTRTDLVAGLTSCIRYDEDGIASAKTWHRLHLLPEVPRSVIDTYFEPATFAWCESQGIERLWVTFNDTMPRTAGWAAARMGERRNTHRPNPHLQAGKEIRRNWRPHGKMIYERFTWQYVIYYSPDGAFFLNRPERDLDTETAMVFRKEFPRVTREWA